MDIRGILRQLGVRFYEHGQAGSVSHGWVGLDCPYCGKPGKPGMGIPLQGRRVATCYKCGTHRLGDALAAAARCPLGEVLQLLGQMVREFETDTRVRGKYEEPKELSGLLPVHQKYLARRGYDPDELVELWGLRGLGNVAHGTLRWRVFIPVPYRGRPGSWTTRAVGADAQPRYYSALPAQEAVPLKENLFGYDHVSNTIAVVEGPFDAMRIGYGAAATFGLNVTPAQLLMIARIPVRWVISDNQPDAQRRAEKLCNDLAPFPGTTARVRLTSGKDPDLASERDLAEVRAMLK